VAVRRTSSVGWSIWICSSPPLNSDLADKAMITRFSTSASRPCGSSKRTSLSAN